MNGHRRKRLKGWQMTAEGKAMARSLPSVPSFAVEALTRQHELQMTLGIDFK